MRTKSTRDVVTVTTHPRPATLCGVTSGRVGPQRVVLIAATPRSGSTLLARGLAATGVVGNPLEHLNRVLLAPLAGPSWRHAGRRLRRTLGHVRRWARPDPRRAVLRLDRASVERHLADVAAQHTGPDGTFSCKVMWDQLENVLLSQGLDVDAWHAPVTWVRIRRADRVAQAVSWCLAISTDRWSSEEAPRRAPHFDAAAIAERVANLDRQEQCWDRYFAERSVTPHEVAYDALDSSYDTTLMAVLEHLGHPDTMVPPRQLERLANSVNADWIARFHAATGPAR